MSGISQTLDIADARRLVYETMDDPDLTIGEQQRRALTVGCRYLDVDHPGFCTQTIEQNRSLAIADAVADGFADSPGYTDHGVACYLGAKITVDGETYGTLCFGSTEPRDRSFTPEERTFVDLLARIFGKRIAEVEFVEAFQRAQSKYETLTETATDALFLVDAETGRITEANAAAAELQETTED
ncbi:MAG: GAF domain-containing protein, partial [Halobaculum sp.]